MPNSIKKFVKCYLFFFNKTFFLITAAAVTMIKINHPEIKIKSPVTKIRTRNPATKTRIDTRAHHLHHATKAAAAAQSIVTKTGIILLLRNQVTKIENIVIKKKTVARKKTRKNRLTSSYTFRHQHPLKVITLKRMLMLKMKK